MKPPNNGADAELEHALLKDLPPVELLVTSVLVFCLSDSFKRPSMRLTPRMRLGKLNLFREVV
jgi:hypothetical protein